MTSSKRWVQENNVEEFKKNEKLKLIIRDKK